MKQNNKDNNSDSENSKLKELIESYTKQIEDLKKDLEDKESYIKSIEKKIKKQRNIEAALINSEKKFRILVDFIGEGVGVSDFNEEFVFTNKAADELFETNGKSLIERNLNEFLDANSKKNVESETAKRKNGEQSSYEIEIITDRKNVKHILVTATPYSFSISNTKGTLAVFRDITERKNAEQELQKMQTILEKAEEISCMGSYEMDIETKMVYLSEGWHKIHGTESKAMSLDNLMLIAHPLDKKRITEAFDNAFRNKKPYDIEHRIIRQSDNVVRVVKSSGDVIYDKYGKPIKLYGSVQDITDRKIAQEALAGSEKKFKKMFRELHIPLAYVSKQGEVSMLNKSFLDFFGYEHDEIPTLNEWWLFAYPEPQYRYAAQQKWKHALESANRNPSEKILPGEYIIHTKSGEPVVTEVSGVLIDNFILAAFIDLTKRKRAEEKLGLQNQELVKLNADKDKFIQILAHDLRSPFNTILGFLQLLSTNIREYDIETIERKLDYVNASAKKTYRLLEKMLTWVIANSGKMQFLPQATMFRSVCNDAIEELHQFAENKKIKLCNHVPDTACVNIDVNMIYTVLRNLISNGIKFTKPGGTVSVSLEQNPSRSIVSVEDTGVGIADNILKNLFDISKKTVGLGTANEKGTGIGLMICKEFVKIHGGEIWAESTVGEGSKFIFNLPNIK